LPDGSQLQLDERPGRFRLTMVDRGPNPSRDVPHVPRNWAEAQRGA
jgi:hypothetical protein